MLSTDEARTAVGRMQAIIAGGLPGQLDALRREGQVLSDPSVWDGVEAARFRSEAWPAASAALVQCLDALEHLQQHIARVNQNIMLAGGNG